MKNSISFLLFLLLLASCQKKENKHLLQTDGVYVTDIPMHGDENLKHYLKFNIDSTVYATSSSYKLEIVKNLLESPTSPIERGNFTIIDDSIKFKTNTESGVVVYKGKIEQNSISLKVKSHINGREFQEKYDFQPY
ncbi:hypothetical protein [Pontibacter ruber]|uniref:Lipoprotein n=1 Tax=Pontibacter ruber TaxID=1343895 RepID=A0ABW5D2R8_9BACT|nr:hypothetical protein [Pontibacter ruber]